MNEKIDVLAVIDHLIGASEDEGKNTFGEDLHAKLVNSRAAIAELIDSQQADARLVAVLLSYLNDNLSEREKARLGAELMTRDLSDHAERRAAALARVGGAK